MFVTLLRKQFLELYKFIFQNKKTGERRSKKSIISGALGFGLLMLLIAMAFVGAGVGIISSLHPVGLDWMYFLMMIIMSILLGAFGSVFNTYAALFNQKKYQEALEVVQQGLMEVPGNRTLQADLKKVQQAIKQ